MPSIDAAAVTTESFERDRVQLRVEGDWSASELNTRLRAVAPSEFGIETLSVDDGLAKAGLWNWAPAPRPKLSVAIRRTPAPASGEDSGSFPAGGSETERPLDAPVLDPGLLQNPVRPAPD